MRKTVAKSANLLAKKNVSSGHFMHHSGDNIQNSFGRTVIWISVATAL
jgi:hypothetical protein